MNSHDTREYEMLLRVQACGAAHGSRIPVESYAGELFARLGQTLARLEAQTTAQSSSARAVAESGASKASSRAKLRAKIEAISRTAKPMNKLMPGVADKFRVPARLKDQDMLTLARGVAADTGPLKAEFIKRGLPSDFREDLSAATADFEQAVSRRIQNTESRVTSTATVRGVLKECREIVKELDPVMRNIFEDDLATLAAWESASRVERVSRRAKSNGGQGATLPAPDK
jgi:hypothetical protein